MSIETDIVASARRHGTPDPGEQRIRQFLHDLEHAAGHLVDPRLVRFALYKLRQASYGGTFP